VVVVVKIAVSLVALEYLYRNGYLEAVGDAAVSTFSEVVKVSLFIAIPILPSGLVYYTSSFFLGIGPTTALATATFGMGLFYSVYQLSPKEVQKKIDTQLQKALVESAKLLPKIPITVGRVLDGVPVVLMATAAMFVLSSTGTFGAVGVKRKRTKQVKALKSKKEKE
jgi:hypothetical protein